MTTSSEAVEEDIMTQSESFSNSMYTDHTQLGERELSTFIIAVVELFGADQARMSVEDWLDESGFIDGSPRSTQKDWQAITSAASARLANRLNVALHRRRSLSSSTTGTQASQIPTANCFDSTLVS